MLRIPILTYHHVVANEEETVPPEVFQSPFTVTADQFCRQMDYLVEGGYQTIDFQVLFEMLCGNLAHTIDTQKTVAICFDDGWDDNYAIAYPEMVSRNIRATLFMIAGAVGRGDCLSADQLREMQTGGVLIGSHTCSHQPLELLSEPAIQAEFTHSQQLLQTVLGRPVRTFSYPHGSYTPRIARLASRYFDICGTSRIGYVTERSSLAALPRIMIRRQYSLDDFRKFCGGEHRQIVKSAAIQQVKNMVKNTMGLKNYMRLHSSVYGTSKPVFRKKWEGEM